jgi:hypothetical protein
LVGREVPPGYISPNLPQKFYFIQQKSEKKERESTKDRVPLNPFLSQATTKVKLELFTSNKGNTNFSIQPHHELVVLEHL